MIGKSQYSKEFLRRKSQRDMTWRFSYFVLTLRTDETLWTCTHITINLIDTTGIILARITETFIDFRLAYITFITYKYPQSIVFHKKNDFPTCFCTIAKKSSITMRCTCSIISTRNRFTCRKFTMYTCKIR